VTILRSLRGFWLSLPARLYGSRVNVRAERITRLRACAPTVKPEETARLAAKGYNVQAPVDFDRLPV
jgi:hypothetical protein